MPGTGFIDHLGIGVPDLAAAKAYYDELMPILGLTQWFPVAPDSAFNYGPDGARGPQLFFYQSVEEGANSHQRAGLQHLAFMVESRAIVREAHEWASAKGAEILHEPREFPEYGPGLRTYWLDPHGFMLEVVAYATEAD
jgi:catechol 2,3-dioxygenase-like lactoylglutathione lyase family enzyme